MNSTENEGHEGHGGNSTCNSHMLWNWETKNVCIVFSWWSANSVPSLIFSCLIVLLLAVSFEVLRNLSRKYDLKIYSAAHRELEGGDSSNSSTVNNNNRFVRVTYIQQFIRSVIYSIQVFLSFFLMLIFMTFNGFLIISLVIGAGLGYFFFGKHTLSGTSIGEREIVGCH
ncbi:hypothetical protein Glove_541g31 [Diversispora epigaea]|uniref:Copper transport protein n=1 Tax=Diversispora epigaea TaxID=1348612 RepID=A0A397GCU6_9GLOM|nr:hypothetical protein Glove_541g31 [Diversispora epigaea]